MPDGGIVTTFTDITPSVKAAEALERANESLERRVQERTEELTRLNAELGRAKAEAEEANISKTRFLAAASHDILQPLNAARLYVTSLVERQGDGDDAQLVGNIDASLDAVEEILGALLDISRLDAGAMKPEIVELPDRRPVAPARGRVRAAGAREGPASSRSCPARSPCGPTAGCCAGCCRTSSRMRSSTRRQGRVLVGCRRRGGRLRIDVYDTGLGIPESKKRAIFQEFHRLEQGAKVARGLGLGLSIVERIARVLDHKVARRLDGRPRIAFLARRAARAPPLREPRPARSPRGRSRAARRHYGAVHRQRAYDSRRHGDAARRLGLPSVQGARSRGGDRRRYGEPMRLQMGFWSTITSTTATASRRSPRCATASAPTFRHPDHRRP